MTTPTKTVCQHEDFFANVDVTRLEDSGRFAADVRIKCTQCDTPFRFIGLPAGCDLNGAATSMDATEARLAIAPKGEVMPAVDGAPHGFSVHINRDSSEFIPVMRIRTLEAQVDRMRAELDAANEAVLTMAAINRLRENEGASVEILCDNQDFNVEPDRVVMVSDDWTNWEQRRFGGRTLLSALEAAEAAKKESKP